FELYWGVRDVVPLAGYRDNLLGVRQAVPALLRLFDEFQIHVTWATVGFLFFDNKRELEQALPPPELRPRYVNAALSPYEHLARIGADETEDPYHFGARLIEEIRGFPHQEIGTHTFSHYYCLEPGQDVAAFAADLQA